MRRGVTADVGGPIHSSFGNTFKENNQVIIIGAGSSGLFAAYALAYLGIDFQILEANNVTFGGRVRELQPNENGLSSDVPLDLGAEWIHVNPRILQDLLLFNDKVDIETIEYQPQSIYSYDATRKKNHRINWLRWFYKEHKFYNSTWHSYFKTYVYPYVADKLELDSVVESIDYRNDAVIVTTIDGRVYSGSHAIVATPVTILQNNVIEFIPPLPTSKIKALEKVYMAPGLKIWLEFDDKFYPDLQLSSSLRSFITEDNLALYFDALFRKPSNQNIVCFLQVGNQAEKTNLDDEEILNSILKELDEIFDGRASKHFIGYHVQNWSDEPFIKGTYSLNYYDKQELLTSVNRRVYFCGEYTHEKYQATVHGAAISGREAVKRLINENT